MSSVLDRSNSKSVTAHLASGDQDVNMSIRIDVYFIVIHASHCSVWFIKIEMHGRKSHLYIVINDLTLQKEQKFTSA